MAVLQPPGTVTIQLLGRFSVRRGGQEVDGEAFGRPAARRLIQLLLVSGGYALADDIFEALWPELEPEGARRSLQVAASRARCALDAPDAEHSLIEAAGGSYRIRLEERDTVDSERFEAAAISALRAPGSGGSRRQLLERAASLWGGEPLPAERYSDWAIPWRERLIDRQIEVLGELATIQVAAGEYARAIEVTRELLSLDPLNEAAHRTAMVAYARAGRRDRARRQCLACGRALVDGLGIEPADETRHLQTRILAGEAV